MKIIYTTLRVMLWVANAQRFSLYNVYMKVSKIRDYVSILPSYKMDLHSGELCRHGATLF